MKVGIVTCEKALNRRKNSMGSSRIRGRWLWENWDGAEEWKVGGDYDAMIFQKVLWNDMMERYDGIKILDSCDPTWLEGVDYFKTVDMVDAVVTSTDALRDYILKMRPGKKVVTIKDRIEFKEHSEVKTVHATKIKRVVWFGYSKNYQYVEPAIKILKDLGIHLTVISDSRIMLGAHYADKLDFRWYKYEYSTIHARLIECDAGLFVENRGKVSLEGKYKSENKRTTCMALGLPIVLVPEDFDRLATVEARTEDAKEKLEYVKKNYDISISVSEYKSLLDVLSA